MTKPSTPLRRRVRIVKDLALAEISFVDKPAQRDARASITKAAEPTPTTPNPATVAKLGASIIAKARAVNLRVNGEAPTAEADLIALTKRIAEAAEAELTRLGEPLCKALGATPSEARQALSETDHGRSLAALAALKE